MKISEIINYLENLVAIPLKDDTCDRVIIGSAQKEITGIGVSMFATPNVIKQAKADGINLLIVHEPLCYDNMDKIVRYPIGHEKIKLISEAGITVYRCHDIAHNTEPDIIYEGQIESMGLLGRCVKGKHWAVNRYVLDNEITAAELASILEKQYGIKHIRIIGSTDKKGKNISCCFGTPGHVIEELHETDFVLTGEICEWREAEAVRDMAEMGYNKAVLVMGHIGSEREGMKLLANILNERFSDISSTYIECGEVYSYVK